jgi:hypothetical protein
MVTLSSFRRRLVLGERQQDVELGSGVVRWLAEQEHSGENIGETESHAIFIELKEPTARPDESLTAAPLGPSTA